MFYKETNFKETPIGKIPKDWNIIKLENIAKISSGNTAPQDEKYFKNGKYPFIRVLHLTELREQKYPIRHDFINDNAVSELKLKRFKQGSIIFPKSGESIKLEKRAILKEDSYIVNHLAVIEPFSDSVYNLFLFYYLCTLKTSNYLTKTTMPSLNLSTINKFLIPLPSLLEQQKIAEILSTIDEAIQKTNDAIAKTERLKKGLMQELLTKGIGHKKFKDTEIGRIPKEWEVVKVENVTTKIIDAPHKIPQKVITEIPFVSVNYMLNFPDYNFHINERVKGLEYISNQDWEEFSKRFSPECGDVLYSKWGTPGVAKLVNTSKRFVGSCSLALIKPDSKKIIPLYLVYALNSNIVRMQIIPHSKTSTRTEIHIGHIKKIRIPLPHYDEQNKITEILSTVDEKLEIERNEKARLERIKQAMMDLLLIGKIRVKVN